MLGNEKYPVFFKSQWHPLNHGLPAISCKRIGTEKYRKSECGFGMKRQVVNCIKILFCHREIKGRNIISASRIDECCTHIRFKLSRFNHLHRIDMFKCEAFHCIVADLRFNYYRIVKSKHPFRHFISFFNLYFFAEILNDVIYKVILCIEYKLRRLFKSHYRVCQDLSEVFFFVKIFVLIVKLPGSLFQKFHIFQVIYLKTMKPIVIFVIIPADYIIYSFMEKHPVRT